MAKTQRVAAWTRSRIGAVRAAATGLTATIVLAACGQEPDGPELNEFGVPVDPMANMVTPVLIGLVVTTILLVVAAYVAYRLGREKDALPKPGRQDAWWTCGSCGEVNTADRDACFACHVARHAGTGDTPGTPGPPPGS
jgi:hypothetical protein